MSDNRQNRKFSELEKVSTIPVGASIPIVLSAEAEPNPEKRNKMLAVMPGMKMVVGTSVFAWVPNTAVGLTAIDGVLATDELTAFVISDPNGATVVTALYTSGSTIRVTLSATGTPGQTMVFVQALRPI